MIEPGFVFTLSKGAIRASTLVVLNSYIAIFSTTKNQNVPCNGGAKAIFFGFTTTVHS